MSRLDEIEVDERTCLLPRQGGSSSNNPHRDEQAIEIPPIIHTGFLKNFIPFGFFYELKQLIRLALPIAGTSLVNYAFGPISVMFCGHLGKTQLATVGLAISIFNVTGLAVAMGLLTACDTLFAQIFGSQKLMEMGLNLQRSIILMTLCCFPCWAIHLFAEPLLLLMKQNPLIAKEAAKYLIYMIPSLFKHVYPPLVIGVICNLVNALFHYIFLYLLNFGIKGSALAQCLAYILQLLAFLCYTRFSSLSQTTWCNYGKKLLDNWGLWFCLAIPGLFMVTLEWTIFEIGSIISGILGENELAAQTIIYNIESMCYTLLPLGLGLAASIRVGHFLGAKCSIGSRSVNTVALIALCAGAVPLILAFVFLRWYIPRIFTSNENVIDLAANLLPILASFLLFDGIVGVCSGVIRGAGLQYIGASICFVSYYIVGAPMGVMLIFIGKFGLDGLWWGLVTGTILASAIYIVICCRINWSKQVIQATKRLNSTTKNKSTNQHSELPSIDLRTDYLPDILTSSQDHKSIQPQITQSMICRRFLIVLAFSGLLLIAVIAHSTISWSKYFGVYCVYDNGTYSQFANLTELENQIQMSGSANCSILIP